ncbi:hypothetical protein HDU97_006293 [Phlyctochytrium planicorne]|nr:hypothetical protein HDU97_006293 [Phlyctochytrium planicorne]
MTVNPGYIEIIPGDNFTFITNNDDPQPEVHPKEPKNSNYFFFKFQWDDDFNTCYDLTPFQYITFNMSMPAGAETYLTLTTKGPACNTRVKDSTYQKMSKYIPADGKPHLALIDMKKDFGQTYDGAEPHDFVHNKDLTMVAMTPGVSFKIYSISLIGDCSLVGSTNSTPIAALPSEAGSSTTTTGTTVPTSVTSTDSPSSPVTSGTPSVTSAGGKQGSGAKRMGAGWETMAVAAVAAVLGFFIF